MACDCLHGVERDGGQDRGAGAVAAFEQPHVRSGFQAGNAGQRANSGRMRKTAGEPVATVKMSLTQNAIDRGTTMILRTLLLAAALQCAFLTQPFAQEVASCDGTWKYTHIDKARGRPADVEVKITGDKGTYVAHLGQHKAQNSPCREKVVPVVVQQCTADELVFDVLGDAALAGCPTFTARFKRTGPDSITGTISRETVTARRER